MPDKAKHTPGPWHTEEYGDSIRVSNLDGLVVVMDDGKGPLTMDDARLISAAPDLMAACKLALELLPNQGCAELGCAEKLRAAIAKAEGRS